MVVCSLLVVAMTAGLCPAEPAPDGSGPERFTEPIAGTALELEMIRVPGTTALYFSRCEITWDLFDAFIYKLDQAAGSTEAELSGQDNNAD